MARAGVFLLPAALPRFFQRGIGENEIAHTFFSHTGRAAMAALNRCPPVYPERFGPGAFLPQDEQEKAAGHPKSPHLKICERGFNT